MIGNFMGNPMIGNMLGGLMKGGQNQQQSVRPQPIRPQPQSIRPQPQSIRLQPTQSIRPQQGNNVIPNESPVHIPSSAQEKANTVEIDGPSGVDDLLKSLTKGTNADLTEIQMSDGDTVGELSDLGSTVKTSTFHNKRATKTSNQKKKLNLKL